MATPTITHDWTDFNLADSISGWSGWGQNSGKWALDNDIYIQGTGSVGIAPFQTGDGGYGYVGTSFNAGTRLIVIWVFVVDPKFVDTKTNYGVYVRVATGSDWTSNYRDYRVGGSDVAWVGKGWHCIVLDANRTPDRSNGTVSLSAVTRVGVGFNMIKTASKSTAAAIDAIRHGTKYEICGSISTTGVNLAFSGSTITRPSGSFTTDGYVSGDRIIIRGSTSNDGVYTVNVVGTTTMTVLESFTTEGSASGRTIDQMVRLLDVYNYDIGATSRFYGAVTRNPLGMLEINFPLFIGDESGTLRTAFLSESAVAYFADQPTSTTGLTVTTKQDTGAVTRVQIGRSTGTGDDRVGFGGSVFSQNTPSFSANGKWDLSTAITEVRVFGSVFLGLGRGVSFPAASGHLLASVTFDGCAQVDLGQIEARGLTFSNYAGSLGSLLWNSSINIKNSNFLANTRAIQHTSAAGSPYTYTGLRFAGNTYDVNNTSGSGITINLSDSNASTYTGSTVTFASTVTVTLTGLQANSEVRVYKNSDGSEIDGVENSGTSFPFTTSQGTVVNIIILHLSYEYLRIHQYTVPAVSTTLPVQQRTDRWYSNP